MTIVSSFLLFATVWLSVFAWAGVEVLKTVRPERRSFARILWTTGAALLVLHTAIAFHFHHGWSHAAALEATARQSEALTGSAAGWGLYLNYAFVLVWIADAAWWWISPLGHDARSRRLDVAVFVLFLFMMLNGAVIFGTSPMRLGGLVAVTLVIVSRAWLEVRRRVYSGLRR